MLPTVHPFLTYCIYVCYLSRFILVLFSGWKQLKYTAYTLTGEPEEDNENLSEE